MSSPFNDKSSEGSSNDRVSKDGVEGSSTGGSSGAIPVRRISPSITSPSVISHTNTTSATPNTILTNTPITPDGYLLQLQISISEGATIQNGIISWTVVSYLDNLMSTYTRCTFYREHRVLHINRVESSCGVRGLGREVLVRVIRFVSEYLGFPCIYLFSSPVPVCYLKRKEAPFDTRKLLEFWVSVLTDAGYTPRTLGHAEIRKGQAEGLLIPNKELIKCIPKMEDDPLSRILKHMNNNQDKQCNKYCDKHQEMEVNEHTIRDALVILSSSRDISKGTILIAESNSINKQNTTPDLTDLDDLNNLPDLSDLSGIPKNSLISVETQIKDEKTGTITIKGNINIKPEEIRKRPVKTIIRMKRKTGQT